ncbi:14703_t:CDS:2, partial [Gigaspora margarita]
MTSIALDVGLYGFRHLIQQRDEVTVQFFNQVHYNHYIDTSSLLTNNVEYTALINNNNVKQSITSYQNIDDLQACDKLYAQLIEAKSVKQNFNLLEQITFEIASLKQRNTMP